MGVKFGLTMGKHRFKMSEINMMRRKFDLRRRSKRMEKIA
jgi:hypothetical protein